MLTSKTMGVTVTENASWSTIPVAAPHRAPAAIASRGRVLLIGDNPREAETFRWAANALHVESVWLRHGLDGLLAAREVPFDLALVDLELPDMSGLEVVRNLRADEGHVPVIVLSGFTSLTVTEGPVTPRVLGLLARPFKTKDVIHVIGSSFGLTRRHAGSIAHGDQPERLSVVTPICRSAPGSIAERWAWFVLRTIDAEGDPKTVDGWARAINVSRSVLCECCRLIHVSPHDARDFARLVRAICRCGDMWEPEAVLDLSDARSLRRLLARAGLPSSGVPAPTVPELLRRQKWIPAGNAGLRALRILLSDAVQEAL